MMKEFIGLDGLFCLEGFLFFFPPSFSAEKYLFENGRSGDFVLLHQSRKREVISEFGGRIIGYIIVLLISRFVLNSIVSQKHVTMLSLIPRRRLCCHEIMHSAAVLA